MPRYLLDTNIISDAIRNTRGAPAGRIVETDPDDLCTSIVVAAELRFGVEKKGSAQLAERVDKALASLDIVPLSDGADIAYGKLRAELERIGKVIGANDMLIAAHAISIDAVLVTDNIDEFSRIPDLKLENWIVRPEV